MEEIKVLNTDTAYLIMMRISLMIGKKSHLMMANGMLGMLLLVTNKMKELIQEQYGSRKMLEEMMETKTLSF